MAGIMSLSVDKNAGLWARVGGDGLDGTSLTAPSGLEDDLDDPASISSLRRTKPLSKALRRSSAPSAAACKPCRRI
ncbi:hypothetical protein BSZ19_13885 [Bradyrhizobium japonicum]|uniref:Uncharacterized protein n=1 Tax=Bradyrhizobium japonicum TaxID=375 RepID=A0A1Y2JRA7_BRAJP|nr:hypothetical protein BSZ19_13885 [Bradyrhizobium japonicum]